MEGTPVDKQRLKKVIEPIMIMVLILPSIMKENM